MNFVIINNIEKIFTQISHDESIDKRFLIELFYTFELPLSIDEFLEPIGKKDVISFSDFCLLFKSKKFIGQGSIKKMENEMFPVTITKFRKNN
jgi:hypothetical protein